MKSLTHKLAVIFLIMTVPTCVIGVNALWSVRTAFAALEANDRALKNLTSLLQSAGETLRESNALQESARQQVFFLLLRFDYRRPWLLVGCRLRAVAGQGQAQTQGESKGGDGEFHMHGRLSVGEARWSA